MNNLELLEILPGTLFFDHFIEQADDDGPELAGGSERVDELGGRHNSQIHSRISRGDDNPLSNNWLHQINVPNPSSINWEGEIMTNIEKNAKGDVFLEYINKKRKVAVSWDFLTQVEYNRLFSHLGIDFRVNSQNTLYYRVKTLNPNGAMANNTPQIDTMVTYLSGKHVGNIKVYYEEDDMLVGYNNVSLTFIER